MSAFTTLSITEDGFAFDSKTGESYILNSCAQLVIKGLQKGENRQDIIHNLAREFGVTQNTIERDIADFFGQLNSLGMFTN